jgi:hypothetical protein
MIQENTTTERNPTSPSFLLPSHSSFEGRKQKTYRIE